MRAVVGKATKNIESKRRRRLSAMSTRHEGRAPFQLTEYVLGLVLRHVFHTVPEDRRRVACGKTVGQFFIEPTIGLFLQLCRGSWRRPASDGLFAVMFQGSSPFSALKQASGSSRP
jgi:hypothetical protein